MVGRRTRHTPNGDLTEPLHTGDASDSESASHPAKLRIDFDSNRKSALKQQRFSREFRFNAQLSLRVAVGVLIASSIQTRVSDYDPSDTDGKKWVLFPSWYYLGGLSYCAIAVIFTTGKTIGSTLMIVWQAFLGVGMALVYSIVLFACMNVHTQDSNAEDPYDGYIEIDQAFSSSTYWVNLHDFYTTLPWMIIFTVVVLVCPFAATTKKFAVANNLFFILTIINPADPIGGSGLKTSDDPSFRTANILHNLEVYFLIGIVGSLVSLAIMFVPYPIFAIKRLRKDSKLAAEDILDLLNIIIDSYCFKNKNMDHMNFLKLKLQRKFDAAAARHRRMEALLENAWWEQSFGFHYVLGFHRPIMFNYVKLVGSLIPTYARLATLCSSRNMTTSTSQVELVAIPRLEAQMETTLHRYRSTQNRTLRSYPVTLEEMEGNVPLNIFLFSLNSFCSTMIGFQEIHNKKIYTDAHRIRSFLVTSVRNFFKVDNYTDGHAMLSAFRGSVAIIIGIFLSVYVYGFNATVPSTVAYVLGNYLGGSFRATVNRVGGVVAGSVVPSVFQYFIAQICDPRHLNVVLSNIVLFVWLCISMYVCYAGGYSSYAGLVSAFVSTGILMRQSDLCYSNASDNASSIAISSYSSLAQTSVGIVLFIIVELMIYPKSAMYLLRRNIQKTLKLQLEAFEVLFGHHLTKSSSMDAETMEHLREILQVKIPAKHAEQASLLAEAQAEPLMWRPAFSTQKYEKVLESSRRLLNNNTLLFKLYRHSDSLTATIPSVDSKSTHAKWQLATGQFQTAVTDSFKTLEMLFSDAFLYSEPDQTAIFMQMKEAFRLADKDCSGEIDADEVADMLETIFAQSGAVKQGEIHKYVEEFMRVVDKDKSGLVSFEEFVEALENGLKLEVEVYTRRKPKAPALVARRENVLAAIDEDEAGDESENDAPKVGVVESGDHTQSKAPDALEAKVNNSRAAMPSRESYRRSSQASSVDKGKRTSSAASSAPAMCREHDVLNVEEFSSNDIAAQMKTAYVEWLLEERRYEKVSMEELLLLNCLVSGAEGIAKSLTEMAEIVVAS
ncbi:EF-Hand 1, calcium-binding site [Phytophthora cactorum]|nr:EF-Hand 1, calcium-binding site [Phytophthora cactorum]